MRMLKALPIILIPALSQRDGIRTAMFDALRDEILTRLIEVRGRRGQCSIEQVIPDFADDA